jgi:MarR family transcriptional repressor of emrRAB
MPQLTNCIGMMDEGIACVREIVPSMPVPEAALARLLLLVGGSVQEGLDQALKPHRLNDSEFLTLMILFSRPDGNSTPGELCEYTSQGATNMTRIANTLLQRGLITRGSSDRDRRRVMIHITPGGRRFVKKMLPQMFPRISAAFCNFSAADKRHLDRLLRKLAHNLDRITEDTQP